MPPRHQTVVGILENTQGSILCPLYLESPLGMPEGGICMKLQPLHDRIVVEPAESEEMTSGGIILPDSAKEKPQRGTVIAVGPGKRLDSGELAKIDISVGETVMYGKYGGTEVTVGGKDYVILRADDVLAVLEGSKEKVKVGGKK